MNIIPQTFTINSLLSPPTEQLNIPSYQRRYAWKDPQVYALFEDIDMLQDNDGHLFGMLILHTGMHQAGINQIDVVDGQQRLTTLSILLNALKLKFEELENSYHVQQIENLLKCGTDEKNRENKLILGELDNTDYENILKGNLNLVKNENLSKAHDSFTSLINESMEHHGEEWIKTFYNKLVLTAKIIRLDVQQAKDAYKLFETINNRGLRLSATDILKNFILGHAAKIGADKLEEVKSLWSQLIISLDGISTDDFFRQYITSILTRKITKSKLIEEFKNDYFKNVKEVDKLGEYSYNKDYYDDIEDEDEDDYEDNLIGGKEEDFNTSKIKNKLDEEQTDRLDLTDYLKKIVDAASCYSKIYFQKFDNSTLNKKLKDLGEIRSFPTFIYLMHYLQKGRPIKEIFEVVDLVTALMLRRHVCARRTSENDDIFANLNRIAISDEYLSEIKESIYESFPEDDEFEDRFPTHELKGNLIARAKYILREIEYHRTGNTGELLINSGNEVHLEHIIPQKITTNNSKKQFGDWEEYLGEKSVVKQKKYVNRIGNMTLLSGELNITASNNPFTRKKACYRKSNILMTQDLGNSNTEFKFHHVEKRGEAFAKEALKIWKL